MLQSVNCAVHLCRASAIEDWLNCTQYTAYFKAKNQSSPTTLVFRFFENYNVIEVSIAS